MDHGRMGPTRLVLLLPFLHQKLLLLGEGPNCTPGVGNRPKVSIRLEVCLGKEAEEPNDVFKVVSRGSDSI